VIAEEGLYLVIEDTIREGKELFLDYQPPYWKAKSLSMTSDLTVEDANATEMPAPGSDVQVGKEATRSGSDIHEVIVIEDSDESSQSSGGDCSAFDNLGRDNTDGSVSTQATTTSNRATTRALSPTQSRRLARKTLLGAYTPFDEQKQHAQLLMAFPPKPKKTRWHSHLSQKRHCQ
jgi:hypothetical protein